MNTALGSAIASPAVDFAQLQLIPDQEVRNTDFNSDDWETPDWLARKMAGLITWSDKRILEPFAGTGQIAYWLKEYKASGAVLECSEINSFRVSKLCDRFDIPVDAQFMGVFDGVVVYCEDFKRKELKAYFDVIVTNPPFSMGVEAIRLSLKFLNPDNPEARLLYLLPGNYFQAKGRGAAFDALDCHIHHRYSIRGRVGYLRNGVAHPERQIDDAIFDIRPGKIGGVETFIEEE